MIVAQDYKNSNIGPSKKSKDEKIKKRTPKQNQKKTV